MMSVPEDDRDANKAEECRVAETQVRKADGHDRVLLGLLMFLHAVSATP